MSPKVTPRSHQGRTKVTGFDTYYGGKESPGTWQKIVNEIRPHDVFISGYLGHCAITRNMRRSVRTIGIDLDPAVIRAWRAMQWSWIELYEGDAVDIISQLLTTLSGKRVVIYLDPPYLLESRKSQRLVYNYEMTREDHCRLLDHAELWSYQADVDVIISHYPCELYDTRLAHWWTVTYESTTRQGKATERLYRSYKHTTGELHDYRWIGDNKDERYNLKHRMAKNLIRKLNDLEPRKRQAVIYYLKQSINSLKS